MKVILNIGTIRSAHGELWPDGMVSREDVVMCLRAAQFDALHVEHHLHSDRECTHVVTAEYNGPDLTAAAYAVSRALDQDCIAVARVDGGRFTGELIGPRASDWGVFNPAFFDMPRVYDDAKES